jgi:hypothetical protein
MNTKATSYGFYILVLFFHFLTSCKKDEGLGGTSTIKGKVIVYDFDAGFSSPVPLAIYPATDEDTYIIYGTDHTTYDDDYKTSYDGSYEFKYLQKGNYRLFAYTKDSTGASVGLPVLTKKAAFIDVTISSNGSTVNAPDLIILKNNK